MNFEKCVRKLCKKTIAGRDLLPTNESIFENSYILVSFHLTLFKLTSQFWFWLVFYIKQKQEKARKPQWIT